MGEKHCKKGSKVIALVSEANGSFSASVYSVDREMQVYLIIAIFLLTLIIIGGERCSFFPIKMKN